MGIIHVRGPPPIDVLEGFEKNENGKLLIPKSFVKNYVNSFNENLTNDLLKKNAAVPELELEKLGKKEAEK